jgi:SNF2 family DNA or RNA helicase
LLRLAQITSGFYKWNPTYNEEGEVVAEGGVDRFDPNPKIEALIEILKEKGPNDKTIVWANWIQDIKSIRARLEQEGIGCVTFYGGTKEDDRAIAEYEFNHNADIKVFVGNPAAGGTGLNLLGYPPGEGDDYPSNCNHVIYYSQDWSSIKRSQSEDRAHRRGTREPVRITDLCIPRTIDEEIRARVLKKRINAASIADVREILRNVLRGFIDE